MFRLLSPLFFVFALMGFSLTHSVAQESGTSEEEVLEDFEGSINQINDSGEQRVNELEEINELNNLTNQENTQAVEEENRQYNENIDLNAESAIFEDDVLIDQIERLNQTNERNFILKPFIYNDVGKRDPFTPVRTGRKIIPVPKINPESLPELEKFRLDTFTLTGVIWSVNEPKALVRDPEDKVHLLKKNTKIGTKNGYVAAIREGEVIVIEEDQDEDGKPLFTTQVLKMGR